MKTVKLAVVEVECCDDCPFLHFSTQYCDKLSRCIDTDNGAVIDIECQLDEIKVQ